MNEYTGCNQHKAEFISPFLLWIWNVAILTP